MGSPQAKREAVSLLMTERDFGVIRACGLLQISRALYRYRSRRAGCAGLGERIAGIAATKRRYGYRRIYIRLRREGWAVNRKHVYRLYRDGRAHTLAQAADGEAEHLNGLCLRWSG